MKKGLLNLINTDIKNKLLKYYRYTLCIVLFIVFNNCDNIQAPTWQTEVNLPLLSSQFLFSEMLESDGVDSDDDGLIIFEHSEEFEFSENSFKLDDSYFSIPGFTLDGYDSEPQTLPAMPASGIPPNTTSFANDFSEISDGVCIPEQTIVALFPDTTINVQVPIDLGTDVQTAIDELFEEWNYVTIESATLNLNENINLFFPTSFTYQVIGHKGDIIFNDGVFIDDGPRVSKELSFALTLSYNEENPDASFTSCEQVCLDENGEPILDKNDQLTFCEGWEYDSSKTSISMGGEGSSFAIESIESINGTTKEQIITQLDTIPIPTIGGMPFGILGGLVSPDTENVNSMAFSIINNSSFPDTINFSLSLPNFENNGNIFLIDNIEVTAGGGAVPIGDDGDFSNHEFNYYAGCNLISTEADCINNCEWNTDDCVEVAHEIDYLYMEIEFIVPSVTDDIILSNMFDFSISDITMNSIELEELNTIVHDFPITIPEFVMPVPEGSNIEGIQIVNPALVIDIYNPVNDIDNTLVLNLESIYSDGTTDILTIEADLRGGSNSIVLNDVCNNFDSNGQVDLEGSCEINSSISDFLQSSPESISFYGTATLNGTGTFVNGQIFSIEGESGGFGLVLPCSFILGTQIDETTLADIYIIPEVSTQLTPADEDTYESISNSLEEAALISNITNFSPLVGGVSILVSTDSNFFPSYLDDIIDVNHDEFSYADCTDGICTYSNFDAIFTQSKIVLETYSIDGVIGELNIGDIDTIQFTPLSENDLRTKILKFITIDDHLLIARLTLLELPCPTIDENGNLLDEAAAGEAINYHSSIDHDQIGLINFTIGDKPRYINTLMTLNNSSYDDCPNPNANPDGIINLLSTHFINIDSYASFKINLGEY